MTPDPDPETKPATHPVSLLRDIQDSLREYYDATEVTLDAEDWTERERSPGGPSEVVDREQEATISLIWEADDVPAGGPERAPVLQQNRHLLDSLEELTEDYPDAELSTYANGDYARVNLTWEDD